MFKSTRYTAFFSVLSGIIFILPFQSAWIGINPESSAGQSPALVENLPGILVAETGAKSVTFEELGYSADETIQGVTVTRSFGIRWPGTWTTQPGNSVTILFSHAPALAGYSSMAVDFNDVRIGSVMLTEANADHSNVTFSIPNNIIRVGYNALTIEFYMGIHDNYCEDLENPGVWATIHNASFFDLSYTPTTPVPELSLFPFPVLDKSELLVNQVTLVVPDQPSTVELGAVADISSKLGQLNTFFQMNLDVVPESQLSALPAVNRGSVIYIGMADHLVTLRSESLPFVKVENDGITFLGRDGAPIDPNEGILWMDISPLEPTAVRLFVTGKTEDALSLAARGLANDSVYPLLNGQMGVIQGVSNPVSSSESLQPVMTLQDLGYEDDTAHGTFEQVIDYVVRLSNEWQVVTEATFDLHFAHSELLYPQGSILTVSVNDTPVGSTMLTPENAEDAWRSFRIPARVFKIGANSITIATDAQLPYDPMDQYFCNKDHFYDAWVTVYADSVLTLPDGPTALVLDLKNYPFGFIRAADLSDLAFIVPASATADTAQVIAWLGAGLGRFALGSELKPEVISDEALSGEANAPRSQFIVGEPAFNKVIYQLSPILPLPFAAGQNIPQNPELIAQVIPVSETGSVGYIQAALTESDEPRLVVTGSDAQGLKWAARALGDPLLLDILKGDLAILQSPTTVYTAAINQKTTSQESLVPTAAIPPPAEMISETSASWVIWLAGAVLLVTLLIIFSSVLTAVIKRRKEKSGAP